MTGAAPAVAYGGAAAANGLSVRFRSTSFDTVRYRSIPGRVGGSAADESRDDKVSLVVQTAASFTQAERLTSIVSPTIKRVHP